MDEDYFPLWNFMRQKSGISHSFIVFPFRKHGIAWRYDSAINSPVQWSQNDTFACRSIYIPCCIVLWESVTWSTCQLCNNGSVEYSLVFQYDSVRAATMKGRFEQIPQEFTNQVLELTHHLTLNARLGLQQGQIRFRWCRRHVLKSIEHFFCCIHTLYKYQF